MLIFKARRKDPTISHALTASERRVMKILGAAMQKVRAGTAANEDQIIDALRHLPVGKVVDLVPDQPWFDAQGEIEDELVKELVASGQRTGSSFPKIRKEVLTYRFDADRPEAAAWAKKESAKLVTEIIEDQRNTIRDFVSASQMGEFTVTQVARNVRDIVGLTTQQSGWVDNFRNRAISDRMANGETFEQASARAAKETERYQQRIHRYRSETIARTEILRASSEGRNQAWQQGLADGYIDPDSQKQWVAEFDACEICSPLDGETVGISAEFPDGDPPLHPNCRCSLDLVDIDVSDFEDMSWEEIDAELDSLFGEQETDSEIGDSSLPINGDMRAGETYNKLPMQDEWESSMSEDERNALSSYTGKSGKFSADELNDRIRFGNLTDEQAVKVDLIDSSIARAQSLGIKTTTPLYRGQEIELTGPSIGISDDAVRQKVYEIALERFPVGSEVDLGRGSFISTSTDTTPALDASASRRSPGIIFEIMPTAGAPMQGVTKYDDEYEILLPRDKKFQVLDIHRDQVILDSALAERIRTVVQLRAVE